MVIAIASLLI